MLVSTCYRRNIHEGDSNVEFSIIRIEGISLLETMHSGGSTDTILQIGRPAERAVRVVLFMNFSEY
jgi:hypothetical protein